MLKLISIFSMVSLVLGGLLLGYGVTLLRESNRYTTPQTLTYAQFHQASPGEGFYSVTGCRFDLLQAVEEQENNITIRAWVPVFDAQNPGQKMTSVYAEMDGPPTTRLLIERDQQQRYHSAQELQTWVAAHWNDLHPVHDLSGLAHKGVFLRMENDLNRKFGAAAETDVDDLSVIASGWQPNPGRAKLELAGGAALILFALVGYARLFGLRRAHL